MRVTSPALAAVNAGDADAAVALSAPGPSLRIVGRLGPLATAQAEARDYARTRA